MGFFSHASFSAIILFVCLCACVFVCAVCVIYVVVTDEVESLFHPHTLFFTKYTFVNPNSNSLLLSSSDHDDNMDVRNL